MAHLSRSLALLFLLLTVGGATARGDEMATLSAQFNEFYKAGQYRQAITVLERALQVRQGQVGPAHADVGSLLVNLGELHRLAGDLKGAEPLLVRGLATLEKAVGSEHAMVAAALNDLAVVRQQLGDLTRAEADSARALEILEKLLGTDHPDVATARMNLAELVKIRGELDRAEALDSRALRALEKALGPDHPQVAVALNNLAGLCLMRGDVSRGMPLLERALGILEHTRGPSHPEVAVLLHNLAEAWSMRGEPWRAQPLDERALAIWYRAHGENHPNVAQALSSLGTLHADLGDVGRAQKMFEKALAIQNSVFGPKHLAVAETLNSLGLLDVRRDPAQAVKRFREVLAIREQILGPRHALVAQARNNLASALRALGKLKEGQVELEAALRIWEATLGTDHPSVAIATHNLALLAHQQGNVALSRTLYARTLAIRRPLGADHPLLAATLSNYAGLLEATGAIPEAIDTLDQALTSREHHLQRVLATATTSQKAIAVLAMGGDLSRVVNLHLRAAPDNPLALQLALRTVLQRKARGLDAAADSMASLRRRLTAEDRTLLQDIQDNDAQIAALYHRGPGPLQPAQYQATLERLHVRGDQLEQQVARQAPQLQEVAGAVTVQRVQAAIPDGAVLLELVAWWPMDLHAREGTNPVGLRRYAAYVVPRSGAPSVVDLGDADVLDGMARAWKSTLSSPRRQEVVDGARALDEKLMRPIRAVMGSAKTVLISPDGALHMVPFAALRDENNRWLAEQFTFVYLTSGRELLRLDGRPSPREPVLVLADPLYEAATGGSTHRFSPLPGTAAEARALVSSLPPDTRVKTGALATEAALKAVRGPAILHVATHGFFLPAEPPPPLFADNRTRGVTDLWEEPAPMAEPPNPYQRSGIALAGANGKSSTGDDGLITAGEASSLDLWGTKLVVLSACETGMGAVADAEGVVGLRRALTLAGAEAQVMSLWKVDDTATRDLMVGFYRGLAAGKGRAAALRDVQLKMLAVKATAHPFYWAAFLSSGDWRPLRR